MKGIRNMRELKLKRQNLRYKSRYLEEKLKDHSEETVQAFTSYVKNIAFETGMKIALQLFFRNRKDKKSTESESATE
ncbi:hypothetical protein [Sunxiuqinia sp. sy24]|uniref:hypothetical protein n=1 Tax=Sunxiuqinia sp. sy24 TaxID=3461495 RepID=UPI0040457D0B